MSKVWYGNLSNRLEENKMFCDKIEVGTGVTEYYYSDRKAYEVTRVIDQKHIFIREYDHKAAGEAMSNNWELISNPENPEIELIYRYNNWQSVITWTQKDVDRIVERNGFFLDTHGVCEKLKTKKEVKTYNKMNISIGVADYYYDYEF